MRNMSTLKGLNVLITGAGAGLGRALALTMARGGARVFAVSKLAPELEEVAGVASSEGLLVEVFQADVSDDRQCQTVVGDVLSQVGGLDVLVNNAGIIFLKTVEQTTVEDWDRMMAVNLKGPFLYSRAVAPAMKAQRHGLIINVSSRAGAFGFPEECAYCASKFGLEGFTRSLALELLDWGVAAATVHPGFPMRTPMSYTTYEEKAASRVEGARGDRGRDRRAHSGLDDGGYRRPLRRLGTRFGGHTNEL